jgi:hypothetical protein
MRSFDYWKPQLSKKYTSRVNSSRRYQNISGSTIFKLFKSRRLPGCSAGFRSFAMDVRLRCPREKYLCTLDCNNYTHYSSWYELKRPRKVFRTPNTDLAPFALCEFCKSMQTHGDGPHESLLTSLLKFRGPPEWCEVRRRVLYKICKKRVFPARARRAGAMRGQL